MYKVIIIDDERMIREGLKASIDWRKLNFSEVYIAKDGIEGQDLIVEHEPDLVITDIKMPRMNGIEMLEKTKHIQFKKLILSSYDDFEYAKAAIQFQVVDYLLKPIDEDELFDLLEEISTTFTEKHYKVPDILKPVLKTDYENYYINQAVQYIKQNIRLELDNESIANRLNISTSYLMRTFKQYTGITMKDFVNRYRIYHSLQLLKQPLKIYEVSEKIGYNEYKAFNYNFHKYMNMTPNQYIKQI